MFFDPKNFQHIPNAKDREIAADTANDIINEKGLVLYGRLLQDGSAMGFTTEKMPEDTHVCLAVGMAVMNAFAPMNSGIKTKEAKEQDRIEALQKYNAQLDKKIRT